MNEQQESARATGIAMAWVSKITSCSLMMVLPGIGGVWADAKLHTSPLFVLIGFAFGMSAGLYLLLKTVQEK
jgi:F0F1-type ATP synthase assembly protein I